MSRGGTVPALAWAIVACVVLAIVSVFVLPSTPSYDPWAWIVWGREIGSGAFTFATNGGPSWKPLPVVFTTVFGLFGGAAPKLWLIAARAGGLLALLARIGWAGGSWGPRLASWPACSRPSRCFSRTRPRARR